MRTNVRVFLSYAREDATKVKHLSDHLGRAGFDPWMDSAAIAPGQDWAPGIIQAIHDSDFFIACLSPRYVDKPGWVQREIKVALDKLQGMLPRDTFVIPARLEPCEIPEALSHYQVVDLFDSDGPTKLIEAIRSEINKRNSERGRWHGETVTNQYSNNQGSLSKGPLVADLNMRGIDVAIMRRGAKDYLLYWREGKSFNFEDNRWIVCDLESAIKNLSAEPSSLDAFLCLRGDHLIDGFDSYCLTELWKRVRESMWESSCYVAVSMSIGSSLSAGKEDDTGSLSFWFTELVKGGITDIIEISMERYGVDCLKPTRLGNAANNSRIRHDATRHLASNGSWQWKCIIPPGETTLHRLLDGFVTLLPGRPGSAHLIVVVTKTMRSQANRVKEFLEGNREGMCTVALYDAEPRNQLRRLCEEHGLTRVKVSGAFELRYLILSLNRRDKPGHDGIRS